MVRGLVLDKKRGNILKVGPIHLFCLSLFRGFFLCLANLTFFGCMHFIGEHLLNGCALPDGPA